jgi:hypothetical protein
MEVKLIFAGHGRFFPRTFIGVINDLRDCLYLWTGQTYAFSLKFHCRIVFHSLCTLFLALW